MRRAAIIALIIDLIPTIIVWGISYLIQPILPSNINNILFLFFFAFVAVIGVLAGFPEIVDRLSGKKHVEINEQQNKRNRDDILQLVWNNWIEGVLHQSLNNEVHRFRDGNQPENCSFSQ